MSIREFFYFQKSDRKVFLVALCVAVAALAVIFLVADKHSVTDEGDGEALTTDSTKADSGYYAVEGQTVVLQPFDPNTADSTLLLSLGLQPYQVRNIYRYRARGGAFSRPEDFAKIYGLTAKKYQELLPYIRISPEYRLASEVYGPQMGTTSSGRRHFTRWPASGYDRGTTTSLNDTTHTARAARTMRDTLLYPQKIKFGEHIDLNSADTTMLKRVPGIGSYFAKKVVAYRERLGGYCSVLQLMEIKEFPESALDYLACQPGATRRININRLSVEQMRKHPYLNFYQAKAIFDYRRLKGPLHSLDELSLSGQFTQEDIERLAPYVEF